MKRLIFGLIASVAGWCLAGVSITDVTARQRYPWNGKVDITYAVSGCVPTGGGLRTQLRVMAVDQTTYVTNIATVLSGDVSLAEGTHAIVWDMGAQGLSLQASNVVFHVLCEADASLLDYIDWRIGSGSITNGGAMAYADATAVHYAADEDKTEAQKAQARANIGAASDALMARTARRDYGGELSKTYRSFGLTYGWLISHESRIDKSGTLISIKFYKAGFDYSTVSLKIATFSIITNTQKVVVKHISDITSQIEANVDVPIDTPIAVESGDAVGFLLTGIGSASLYQLNESGMKRTVWCSVNDIQEGVAYSYVAGPSGFGYSARLQCSYEVEYGEHISTPFLSDRIDKLEGSVVPKNYPTLIPGWSRHGDYATTELPLGRTMSNGNVLSYGGANLLYGKHVWIFGDSLNDATYQGYHWMADWLEMIAGVRCTVFAKGGTLTFPNGVSNGQDRVMHAIAQQEAGLVDAPDIILYEDINDVNMNSVTRDEKYGTLADKPWMLMQYADFFDKTYESQAAAAAAFKANFDTLVASVENKIAGTMARMKYASGVTTNYYIRRYDGPSDATAFAQIGNWKYYYQKPTLAACYKGIVERLMSKYPTARMYILGYPLTTKVFPDPDHTLNPDYYFADGTLDVYGAKHAATRRPYCQDELIGFQEDVAKLYGIGFIDVARGTQVNLVNIEEWYYSNNVHPKKDTYKRWAEVIYRELAK